MEVITLGTEKAAAFQAEVERRSGQKIPHCYQCYKCSAGCPVAFAMDAGPGRVMRLLQLGQEEMVLKSDSIWLCASCLTCSTRCPQEVDIARIMDTLRIMAKERGYKTEKDVPIFNEVFVQSVRMNGRVFEPLMIFFYNLRSRHFFKDMLKGPFFFFKGKLPLLPHRIKDMPGLRRIFARSGGQK